MSALELHDLADRIERQAVADAKNAASYDLYAKLAFYRFGIAAALRARADDTGSVHEGKK